MARALRRHLTVAVVLAVAAQGCGGVTGPPALSRSERATLEAARFDITVGVQGQCKVKRFEGGRIVCGDEDAWSRDLFIAAMQARRIFREIARIGAYTSPPDVVATVKRMVGGDAPLPFITFLTLGLVPTIATDTQRWEVTFAAPDTKPVVHVVVEHDGTVVIGLAGFLATVAPGWMSARTHHVRTFDHLALAIARKSDALRALAGR